MNLNFFKKNTTMNKMERLAGLIGREASAITAEDLAAVNAELASVGINGVQLVSAEDATNAANAAAAVENLATVQAALESEQAELAASQAQVTALGAQVTSLNAELTAYKPDDAAAAAAAAAAKLGENGVDRETAGQEDENVDDRIQRQVMEQFEMN